MSTIDKEYVDLSGLTSYDQALKNWVDNEISTSLTDFEGATSSEGGAAGQVPAPSAGDDEKFLRGDGTWSTIVGNVTGVKGDNESSYRGGNVNITKANIGLGNVGNFKAVSTVASQGLSSTEQENARANIGAGTSNFSGAYGDLSGLPTIPDAVAVKGDAESSYRTGNVNITLANLGVFRGTTAAWTNTTTADKAKYTLVILTDD